MKSSSNKVKAASREPDKFPPLTMSPFKITALPTMRGVAGLSTTEIKSDLKELLPPSEDNDTDSDSSLMSDDILDSVYPVQPRSAPRSASDAHGFRYQDYSTSGNNVSVDEALFLIKDISKSHNELYAKEKEREEFEQRCQALDTSLEYEKGKFFSTKQEQENYLKLVQGLYARMVRLHSTYSRQNALLHTVYTSLQKQREDEQALTAESAKLKAIGTGAKPVRVTGKAAADSDSAGALLLKVHLRKSNIDVVLQVGQSIPTPMGEGTIAKILPAEQKLVIQLPFGLLYAHLPRAVSWCSTAVVSVDSTNTLVQAHSVHGIQQRYEDTLQDRLTLPAAEVARIHSLVAQQAHSLARRASDEEVANTDNDEASVEDTEEMEDGTVSVTAEAVLASVLSTTDLTEAEQEPTSGNAKASSSSSSSSRRNGNGSGSGEPDHVSVFPMPFDAAAVPARSVVKKKIEAEVNDNFSRYLLQTLPLAFAPAASLPYVAAELGQTSSSTSSGVAHALRLHGVEYDLTALQGLCQNFPTFGAHAGSAHAAAGSEDAPVADRAVASGARTTLSAGGQLGSSSSLAWQGEIDQLKGSLRELGDQISQLETEQNRKIAEIESLRSKSAQLTAAAATTRLNMFTRRLAHRTNLGNRGIVLPPVAPVMTHQNKSRSSNQSRNHSTAHLNSANGSNSHLAGQDAAMAGAAALLLAAGEGRSSRSKKTSANQRTDEPHGTQDSFASLTTGGPAYMTMRASTDSPMSSHSLQGDDAHPTMDARPAANSRSRSRATAFKDDGAETLALLAGNSNKRRNNGRKAADDIIASAGNTQEDEAEAAEGEENENSDAEAPAATGAAPAAAAARKKPKRRRY